MLLDFTPLDTSILFELPGSRRKRISEGDINILMFLLVVVIPTDNDMTVRHLNIEANLVEIAVVLMVMLRLDRDPAAGNIVTMLFEFFCLFADTGLNRFGVRDAVKSDFKRYLHRFFRFVHGPWAGPGLDNRGARSLEPCCLDRPRPLAAPGPETGGSS